MSVRAIYYMLELVFFDCRFYTVHFFKSKNRYFFSWIFEVFKFDSTNFLIFFCNFYIFGIGLINQYSALSNFNL
jgi:hypothetical protein